MWRRKEQQPATGEDGYAMIIAVILLSIMMVMTGGMMATGLHLDAATAKDATWNAALAVAEAGIDQALYELGQNPNYTGTDGATLDVSSGEVEILVSHSAAGHLSVYATGWAPSKDSPQASKRRVRVDYGPEDVFSFALFSESGLTVKNNGITHGDVFANGSVVVEQNSVVYGSVTAATGTVDLQNGAQVKVEEAEAHLGNVHSGGFDDSGTWGIRSANGAVIEGNALAQSTCPSTDAATAAKHSIISGGVVQGDAVALGSITGSVLGQRTPGNCQERAANRYLPEYQYKAELYTNELEFTTIASFQTWINANQSALSGVVRLADPVCNTDQTNVVNMDGATVVDNFVMVTNCRIDADNDFTVNAGDDDVVNIIVQNQSVDPPAVSIKNNFAVLGDTAVLLYSSGLIYVKNNIDETGAVYAGAISIKNNMEVTYDPRVERTLGFGDLMYDRMAWQECKPAATGTDC